MFFKKIFLFLQFVFVSSIASEVSVQFLFYKSDNETIELKNKSISDLNINAQKPVKVLVHGLAGDSSAEWCALIKKAYVAMDYNVFAVDWTVYAFSGYLKAISASQDIGFLIGKFIFDLGNVWNVSLNDVHVIGHSLGAHIAGFSGKFLLGKGTKKIGRITGLDPAGPLHNSVSKSQRLCDEDANFVDVIHTNAGVLGIVPSIGHMDFYPDGGKTQNNCQAYDIECNHNMAPRYFIESVNKRQFEAVLCDSYINYTAGECDGNVKSFMGEHCQLKEKGDYFLTTNVSV